MFALKAEHGADRPNITGDGLRQPKQQVKVAYEKVDQEYLPIKLPYQAQDIEMEVDSIANKKEGEGKSMIASP